jgi:hypothetical protein
LNTWVARRKKITYTHAATNHIFFYPRSQYICQNGNKVIMRSTNDLTAIMGGRRIIVA